MFKKIRSFFNKTESYLFLITTFILFLLIGYNILIYSKNFQLFNNNVLNLITLAIFYFAVYLFLITLYYKLFKFTLMEPSISHKEFKKLWKKSRKIAQELKKGAEDKTIIYNSKKFKDKWGEIKQIEEILDEKSISFKNWFSFFIFSVYFGIWQGLFIWSIKNSTKYFLESIKDFFSFKKMGLGFRWYKLKNGDYIIDSFIYPYRKPVE